MCSVLLSSLATINSLLRNESFHVTARLAGVEGHVSPLEKKKEEPLVFTSPVLMVTNFFAINSDLFYFDCSERRVVAGPWLDFRHAGNETRKGSFIETLAQGE